MAELFNSRAHAMSFLKRRKLLRNIYQPYQGSSHYVVIARQLTDIHEIEALRYLKRSHQLYATIDRQLVYNP